MSSVWQEIRKQGICEPLPLSTRYCDLLVTRDPGQEWHWLIGPHPTLSGFATSLRSDAALTDLLIARKVRLGFRQSDQPPVGLERQESYSATQKLPVTDHSGERKNPILPAVRSSQPAPAARISDRRYNVLTYWSTQTPQAHHIVEFNNLQTLGVSEEKGTSGLDYRQLPCVLLMAEFHQRYVSSFLKPTHGSTGDAQQVLADLQSTYQSIYRRPGPALESLWKISAIIFQAAEQMLR